MVDKVVSRNAPNRERIKVKVLDFFKDTFGIDGEVRFASPEECKGLKATGFIRMEDSSRGVLYVGYGEKYD